jgi:hypothetical protein
VTWTWSTNKQNCRHDFFRNCTTWILYNWYAMMAWSIYMLMFFHNYKLTKSAKKGNNS